MDGRGEGMFGGGGTDGRREEVLGGSGRLDKGGGTVGEEIGYREVWLGWVRV